MNMFGGSTGPADLTGIGAHTCAAGIATAVLKRLASTHQDKITARGI